MELDTEAGGEALSLAEAAAAFVKSNSEEAEQGQPEEDIEEQAEQADDEIQASDEDEAEIEGEPEDEGQSEDEEDTEPESDQGRFVAANGKVRLPDGTVLTVSDLVQGNLRDRDYRQKTMSLADERRAFEEQSSAFKASQQQVEEQRAYMTQLLEAIAPKPPSQSMMDQNSPDYDPIGYMHQESQFRQFQQHYANLQQQSQLAQQQEAQRIEQERQKVADREWGELQKALPELRDEAKLKVFARDIQDAAQAAGFSQDEISQVIPYDHRMALVLRKAAKWDKLQASKPKVAEKVKGRPPVQKSGKRLTPDAMKARQAQDAANRLKETGSMDDAVAAYLASTKG